ncbi:hypothetical protein [Aureimonas ureilytica]|uniref:hypothetical protein n=1 Tax=Aureimonas ureilytica TaxID=401562 RepID=UPI000AEC67B3|nr:hypothetical protein [Aureimonas ureilytica]
MTSIGNLLQNRSSSTEKVRVFADRAKMITSIAEIYSRGGYRLKPTTHAIFTTGEALKPETQEERSKLNGTLSLADLNEYRANNGLKTTLSQIDFDTLLKRTEGHFENFKTDATMNYRRNLYLRDMSEDFIPNGRS